MDHEPITCDGLTAFSGVLLCTRKESKPTFKPLHFHICRQGIVSWLEGAPRVIRNRLNDPTFADFTKRLQECSSPTLLLIEATETVHKETVVDGIPLIREIVSQLLPSVLITPGQSHTLRLEGAKKVPNPGGFDLLLKELKERKLHTIDTTQKTPAMILQEAVKHHATSLLVDK